MAKSTEAARRRHIREKRVIDHLADKVFEPTAPGEQEPATHHPTTETGLPVEEQIRKEWDPRNGGLPIFSRK
jgi:hypothetical protein